MKKRKGFTLIEMITAITIAAIIMIPVALVMMEYLRSGVYTDRMNVASNLARQEAAIITSLPFNAPTLTIGYNNLSANYAGYDYDLRRAVSSISFWMSSTAKNVVISVYGHNSSELITRMQTYVTSAVCGVGSAGGVAGNEADSFIASRGSLDRNSLNNFTIQNTRSTGNITLKAVIMTTTVDKVVERIRFDGEDHYRGAISLPANNPVTIDLQSNFFLNSNSSYSNCTVNFDRRDPSYEVKIVFVFYDDTQSSQYQWAR